ncbi:hypothetical protein VNO78_33319 [Psophocarpus tetragonolobus]|uniref:Uncharacterized protein n=1 Tax=Psophocarpus tetragonolobus TaxID=3891 RepID=A0AAN9NY36_PSOTE
MGFCCRCRHASNYRSPFNPIIVLYGPDDDFVAVDRNGMSIFNLFYEDNNDTGLHKLPLAPEPCTQTAPLPKPLPPHGAIIPSSSLQMIV